MRSFEYFGTGNNYGPHQRYGMEVELEGVHGAFTTPDLWRLEFDGSLRGGVEYISDGPKTQRESFIMLDALAPIIAAARPSPRTSFHVHVDTSFWEVVEIINVIRAYVTLEPCFFALSGGREGSQFCAPIYGSTLINTLKNMLRHGLRPSAFPSFDTLKYGAVNVGHLRDFGSLEFRHHTGLRNSEDGKRWLRILSTFVTFARELSRDDLFSMVRNNPRGLIEQAFPAHYTELSDIDPFELLLHFKTLEL